MSEWTDRQDGWTNRRKEGKNAPTLAETGERLINLEVVQEEKGVFVNSWGRGFGLDSSARTQPLSCRRAQCNGQINC